MQQQTRQRQRRKRKSTPLPKKREGTRQATRSRHANTTQQHMVTPAIPTKRKTNGKEKAGSRQDKTKQTTRENAMVFGDNVRARRAARALPRTPQQEKKRKRRQERETERRKRQATRPHTLTPLTAIPHTTTQCNTAQQDNTHHNTQRVDSRQQTPHTLLPNTNHHRHSTMTYPCHKDTTLNQQCCDSKHNGEEKKSKTKHALPSHNTLRHSTTQTGKGQEQYEREQDNTRGERTM